MQTIARRLTDFFLARGIIPPEERDIYIYGFDITLYTIISTLGLLLLGLLVGRLLDTVIILSVFSLFQTHGGGYHANSHLKCFLTMVVILGAALGISCLPLLPLLPEIALAASALLLLAAPLTLHPNKAYLAPQTPRLKVKSRIVTLLVLAVSALLVYGLHLPLLPFALAFTLSALSRLYALWQRKTT